MTTITMHGVEKIAVTRRNNEAADLILTIDSEDGTTIKAYVGRFYDDAEGIESLLRDAADAVRDDIIKGWEDVPDEFDAYVYEDRSCYTISLEGVSPKGHRGWPVTFPSRDVATYELAALMSKFGCFPNAWFVNERGGTDNIAEAVRKYHDAGGDGLLPLEGVQYDDGAEVTVKIRLQKAPFTWEDAFVSGEVIHDYGTLGIVYCYSGDGDPHFTDDRSDVNPYDDTEETT